VSERLNYGKTFVLGLGFFAISLCWTIYNSFVPVFLHDALAGVAYTSTLVGVIMTFDNIAAVTLQPYFGALSDRTWNRYGRRMPYILVGMPLGAAFFALIPFVRLWLVPIITAILFMNVSMAIFRAPTVALMPDVTPPPLRSKANGVINLMGGVGAMVALFAGSALYRFNPAYPFIMGAVLMILSVAILKWRIVEPREVEGASGEAGQSIGISGALMQVLTDTEKSALYMLVAIFSWFVAWNGIEAFFTLYAREVWGVSEATGATYLGFFSVTLVAFAIPAGFIATSIGRARTIRIGIIGLAVCLAGLGLLARDSLGMPLLEALNSVFGLGHDPSGEARLIGWLLGSTGIIVPALLAVAGVFWALININSYPMVVDMAVRAQTGAYTGLYYLFSSLAAITGPPAFGLLKDTFGTRALFPFSILCALAAFAFMGRVRRGDPSRAGLEARAEQ
jgi:maltose/moltooligosaccharide transporter